MTGSARELIDAVQAELAPRDDENRLIPLVEKGKAARARDARRLSEKDARTHARLFQSYELDFWNTLADEFRK